MLWGVFLTLAVRSTSGGRYNANAWPFGWLFLLMGIAEMPVIVKLLEPPHSGLINLMARVFAPNAPLYWPRFPSIAKGGPKDEHDQ